MADRARKRLESLEQLRAELERVRAQADELHAKVIGELQRVEEETAPRVQKAKRPARSQ